MSTINTGVDLKYVIAEIQSLRPSKLLLIPLLKLDLERYIKKYVL
jgi:hypothetical protein